MFFSFSSYNKAKRVSWFINQTSWVKHNLSSTCLFNELNFELKFDLFGSVHCHEDDIFFFKDVYNIITSTDLQST